ncbi:MAG: hypothetical protein WCA79_04815 [Anaerolineales bacterium]|jgi:hypothetical protein
MDNSIRVEQGSNIQRPNNFLIRSVMFFDRIEKWLAGFFEMTQEEQKDAGICIDDQSDK